MKNALYLSLALLILVMVTSVAPRAQTPTPSFVPCANGGLIWGQTTAANSPIALHCVDPRTVFPGPMVTGGPCSAPAAGTTIYAQLPDKTCYPLVAIAAAGGIAQSITATYAETAMVDEPVIVEEHFTVRLTPGPGYRVSDDGFSIVPAQ